MTIDLNRVVYKCDYEHSINGVPGRFKTLTRKPGQIESTWFKQEWRSLGRKVSGYGADGVMTVNIRFDDCCGNGKNSFAITADIYTNESRRRNDIQAGGCLHDEITEVFPELAPLIKWHLMDSGAPMHYVANTIYHASSLHNGYAKGEPCKWKEVVKFGEFPIGFNIKASFVKWLQAAISFNDCTLPTNPERKKFDIVEVPYTGSGDYNFDPKYSFDDFTNVWHECPFDSREEADEFKKALAWGMRVEKIVTGYSPGKIPNFDHARSSACWPEATDEQLSLPAAELEKLLLARLPAMMEEFKQTIASIGMFWSPAEYRE